jgi:uncharacterized membrane protein
VTVAGVAIAAAPATLASPAFRGWIADHPGAAAYLPIASAIVTATYRVVRPSSLTKGT